MGVVGHLDDSLHDTDNRLQTGVVFCLFNDEGRIRQRLQHLVRLRDQGVKLLEVLRFGPQVLQEETSGTLHDRGRIPDLGSQLECDHHNVCDGMDSL